MRARADRVHEAPQPGVRVDDARAEPAACPAGAPGAHTRRSQASASSSPPPNAWPPKRRDHRHRDRVQRRQRRLERVGEQLGGLLGEPLRREVADVVAGREDVARAGQHDAARVERRQRRRRARRGSPRSSALRLAALEIVSRATPSAGSIDHDASPPSDSTTRRSPSWTDWPSSTRISATVPSSSASIGISIFIDSRITTVSPSSIGVPHGDLDLPHGAGDVGFDVRHRPPPRYRHAVERCPTALRYTGSIGVATLPPAPWTSLFVAISPPAAHGEPAIGSGGRDSWTTPPAATRRAGYSGAMSEPELVELKEQVYKDPRPKEHFDRFHERTRTREPDFVYEVVRILMSLMAWIFFRVRGYHPERVPAVGPVILAPNHFSFLDHFFLGVALRRKVHFMAKSQLFKPPMEWIYTHGGVFPVRRGVRRRGGVHHRGRRCSTAATRWPCTPRAGARAPASCRRSPGAGSAGSRC